jgi:hypothetical protein
VAVAVAVVAVAVASLRPKIKERNAWNQVADIAFLSLDGDNRASITDLFNTL